MKVLITGCRGQLGSELVKVLHANVSELGSIPNIFRDVEVKGLGSDALDITNEKAVMRIVHAVLPDVLINCAAYTNVDACETHEAEAYAVNAIGARNIASAAETIGAKMVHISTDYVFSGDGAKPYRITDTPDPASAYGRTKLVGEQAVSEVCSRSFIVRTAWLYGYEGKNFVKSILRSATEKGMVTVVDDQRGTPTNANDLAYHLLKLAATNKYGIYHCTGNGECTWFDFAKEIIRLSGIDAIVRPCTSADYPSPTKRPKYSVLDHTALDVAVGDEMRNWKDALVLYMEHRDV